MFAQKCLGLGNHGGGNGSSGKRRGKDREHPHTTSYKMSRTSECDFKEEVIEKRREVELCQDLRKWLGGG